MNESAQAKLKEITDKDISAITEPDKVFLRARYSYLTKKQKRVYTQKFLNPPEESAEEKVEEEEPKK